MPESDMAKRITKAIKVVDKLVQDLKRDAEKLHQVVRELREGDDKNEPK